MVPEPRLTWAHWAQALDRYSNDIQDGLGPWQARPGPGPGLWAQKKNIGIFFSLVQACWTLYETENSQGMA